MDEKNQPALVFLATRSIKKGEELVYDYGERFVRKYDMDRIFGLLMSRSHFHVPVE